MDYTDKEIVKVCPNCFTECLANARALRAMIGEISFILATDNLTVEDATAEEIASRIRGTR